MSLHDRITEAHGIVREAIARHGARHTITARVVLFSGGNDSTVLAHLLRHAPPDIRVTHAGHCNTTIGVEGRRRQESAYRDDPAAQYPQTGPLCSSCDARYESRPWIRDARA